MSKLYNVVVHFEEEFGRYTYLAKDEYNIVFMNIGPDLSKAAKLTSSEINEIDERYLVFAEEVTE